MGNRSSFPSQTVIPDNFGNSFTILDFLEKKFPRISREFWKDRLDKGIVHDENMRPISADEPCTQGRRIFYYREVEKEITVPFTETILYSDDHLLVADKPHFLPVTPSGRYVNHCLLNRLKKTTGNSNLTPVHRIDRETAGIVIFSVNPETRGLYQSLFMTGSVKKTYEAVTHCTEAPPEGLIVIENRMVKGEPFFVMKTEKGSPNSKTYVKCVDFLVPYALFHVEPETGKKHQIRLHLSELGCSIVNDSFYPVVYPEKQPDFKNPLQLLARSLSFKDPITGKAHEFQSHAKLELVEKHHRLRSPVQAVLPEP